MLAEEVLSRSTVLADHGKYDEAFDLLSKAIVSDESLWNHLGTLVDYATSSGKQLVDFVVGIPSDQVEIFLRHVINLSPDIADHVLETSYGRVPEGFVLAVAASVAPHLMTPRALVWSARLRQLGVVDVCPLIARANDVTSPSSERIRAAATAYRAFGDARALEPFVAATRRIRSKSVEKQMRDEITAVAPELLGMFEETISIPVEERDEPLVPLEVFGGMQEFRPKVSVLITLYNYEDYIEECVRSVLTQSYENIEIIVVDDCSTDSSLEIVRRLADKDPRVLIHENKNNIGAVENLRLSYELSTGELVQLLSADNRFAGPETVARLVSAIGSDSRISMAAGGFGLIDENGTGLPDNANSAHIVGYACVMDGPILAIHMLKPLMNFLGESVMFKKDALNSGTNLFKIGSFEIRGLMDYAWWLRLCAVGKVAYIPDELIQHRNHTKQLGSSYFTSVSHVVDLYSIIEGCKEIGVLSDPLAESVSLSNLLYRASGLFQHMVFANASEVDEFELVMTSIIASMSGLARGAL
ncbi:MAG: glycosyltransferase [Acidimicrobiaceae bacterium]|nr:glycosyltransferase [Acidimicrobiaceae bacterium]